ncbi:hypothetical protein ACFS33_01320 [Cellulomonas phragmiteti]|uniref:hypothetical protein n=1 Tax=Cellulomonas phragmiteti TaxID=478780 RepID=UPI0035E54CCF
MSPTPLRRAATIVALSVLALGGSAVAAQAEPATPTPSISATPTVSPTPSVSPTPTVSPTPSVSPTPTVSPTPSVSPTPTASPTVTPEPTTDPEPVTVPVPVLDVVQPKCVGSTVVPNGRVVIKPAPSVVWAVVTGAGTVDEDFVAEADDPGQKGDVELAPGSYEVWALNLDGDFGDLGEWRVREYFIARSVTIKPFTGPCPAVVATPTPAPTATSAWAPSADQLTAATQGGFTTAARVDQGGTLTLAGLTPGAQVRPFLFSVPTDLGAATVAADGTLKVTVPAATTAGTHRVAVYLADGTLVGWQYVEVLAAGQSLAATGADPRAGVLAAVVLVAAGGALVLARRRLATR